MDLGDQIVGRNGDDYIKKESRFLWRGSPLVISICVDSGRE